MGKRGTRGSTKPYHDVVELNSIIHEFSAAMRTANPWYVAKHGTMTPRMTEIWNRYRTYSEGQIEEI